MEEHFSSDNQNREPRSIESIILSGFRVNSLAFISKGFRYFSDEFGIYVAFTLVYIALSMALSALPVVGDLSGMLVGPPLVAGFAFYVRLQSRNEYREFSHFFGGFRGSNWPSLVSQGISVTLTMALAVAAVVLPFFLEPIQVFLTEVEKIQTMDQQKAGEFVLGLFNPEIGWAALLAAITALAVLTLFCLAPLFIVYRGYSAFQAIGASWKLVSKKYPAFLLFNLLLWLMLIVGFLMCCIGLLAALPVYYLSLASAYEEITGD
jgi:uncharacterized membrane protein